MALFDRLVGGLDKVIHSFALRDLASGWEKRRVTNRLVEVFSCGGVWSFVE